MGGAGQFLRRPAGRSGGNRLSSTLISPRSLAAAARALENPRRAVGKWPYQWLFPGPNSSAVHASGFGFPGAGLTSIILSYEVPDGLRFSLRALVFGFNGTGWVEGTPTGLSFTLQVLAAGTRAVEFFANQLTHLGSADQPYPILGRLEFAPLDILQVLVFNGGGIPPAASNNAFAFLDGHTYPNSEVVG